MIKIHTILDSGKKDIVPDGIVTLDYAKRQKCTQRVMLDNGDEVGLMLPRGTVLHDGDMLEADNGWIISVCAAKEALSVATCQDPDLFARACYHLGNRHAPAQICQNILSYQHDHVLDDMLIGLGLSVHLESAPFSPENGAYHNNSSHNH